MTEKQIETKIKAVLKQNNILFYKIHGSAYQVAGIPDLLICFKGRFIGCELKLSRNKLSPLQAYNLQHIKKNNGISLIVDERTYIQFNEYIILGDINGIIRLSAKSAELYNW